VTIQIVFGDAVSDFVSAQCGVAFSDPKICIGYARDGKVCGGAVLNNWNGRNVEVSVGHDANSWPMAFLKFVGDYVWNTMKAERATFTTRPETEHFCLRLGARREGVMRGFFPDGDAIVCGLLKHEWGLGR